jgi:hypothetical protein
MQAQQAIEVAGTNASAIQQHQENELSVDDLVKRVGKVQEVARRVMQDGLHFGKIPGVDKPTLLKPGAEILCLTFRLAPVFSIDEISLGDGHRDYRVKCTLMHIATGASMGDGHGSCSTKESKYAWRNGERKCPTCGKPCIIKGKEQYGGGWLCFAKKGGCGAKFATGDQAIEGQSVGRVANEDIADTYNTVLKMACKRALVAAVLIVTGASALFTQDVEDMGQFAADAHPSAERTSSGTVADELANRILEAKTLDELKACGAAVKAALTAKRITEADSKRLGTTARAQGQLISERKRESEPPPPPADDHEPEDDTNSGDYDR